MNSFASTVSSSDRQSALYARISDAHQRLAKKDPTIWGLDAVAEATIRLNWVDLPEQSRDLLPTVDALAAKHRDKKYVVLAGMGGSSLGPEVIAQTYQKQLFILDSTDPHYLQNALSAQLEETLVIVSSKSGSTIETASARAFFAHEFERAGLALSNHMIIVTDPGSPLDKESRAQGLSVINADPHVGGRFSVLSAFGLVPSALIGVDISILLDSASDAKSAFLNSPQAMLDCAYVLATAGQYLTFTDENCGMPGLSDWIEQLVAESTGKNQVGRLPVVVEDSHEGSEGNPLRISFTGNADCVVSGDLGAQFITWEWLTALVGAALEIDPFNQPNVTEAKEQTSVLLTEWSGNLPTFEAETTDRSIAIFGQGNSVLASLQEFISSIPEGGYIAIMAYLDRTNDVAVAELRKILAHKSGRPVTFGWGPRFLHSTGQFHKGGQRNGAFLQITGACDIDFEIPGKNFGFETLLMAQALGDGRALESRSYPLLRLHLNSRRNGIGELLEAARQL
jgi:glucose-6-phosphate isomerase